MRLSYPLFETPIVFAENQVNILVIENQKEFAKFVMSLVDRSFGNESEIILSKNFEIVKFDKLADVVTDIVGLDCNNKKVISKLYGKLGEIAFQEENYMLTVEILSQINEYLLKITQSISCGVCFDENFELGTLFKGVSLKIDTDKKVMIEKICDYIEIMCEFCNMELFIFVGLKSYLTTEELEEFYKFIQYKKVKVLLVESLCRERLEFEKIKIIDKDLCEIS